jgi:hypothetical protein
MEKFTQFSISEKGENTGRDYSGVFKIKTVLTRSDVFLSDQRRRDVLGPNGETALDALKAEAFMLGQLYVRIVDAPKFWAESNFGLELEDVNVITALFNKCLEAENERKEKLNKKADDAKQSLIKQDESKE